jgi:mannosylglycerate hydrolase MGH1-like protein
MRSCPLALAAGAFIAIGWAHLDVRRAMTELEQLFAAQWSTGMVPHIVFRAGQGARYFPGPEWWDCAAVTPAARGLPAQTTGSASRRCTRWRCAGSGS